MPKVNLKDQNSKITFYASDITGKFEVILEGFSVNGKPVFIKEIIEIKETDIN